MAIDDKIFETIEGHGMDLQQVMGIIRILGIPFYHNSSLYEVRGDKKLVKVENFKLENYREMYFNLDLKMSSHSFTVASPKEALIGVLSESIFEEAKRGSSKQDRNILAYSPGSLRFPSRYLKAAKQMSEDAEKASRAGREAPNPLYNNLFPSGINLLNYMILLNEARTLPAITFDGKYGLLNKPAFLENTDDKNSFNIPVVNLTLEIPPKLAEEARNEKGVIVGAKEQVLARKYRTSFFQDYWDNLMNHYNEQINKIAIMENSGFDTLIKAMGIKTGLELYLHNSKLSLEPIEGRQTLYDPHDSNGENPGKPH